MLERQVRRQLNPLMTKAASGSVDSVLSKSILPTIAGEQFSERIIADVVNEIASYADRETLVENSAGQQQLMNSLERTVSNLFRKLGMRVRLILIGWMLLDKIKMWLLKVKIALLQILPHLHGLPV